MVKQDSTFNKTILLDNIIFFLDRYEGEKVWDSESVSWKRAGFVQPFIMQAWKEVNLSRLPGKKAKARLR
jgi:hypothetical protein